MAHILFQMQELFDSYPDSDMLGCGPPRAAEALTDYKHRVARDGGDTLYLFLVRELVEDDTCLALDVALHRVSRAVADLQAVESHLQACATAYEDDILVRRQQRLRESPDDR